MQCPIQTAGDADILLDYCNRKLSIEATAALERHIENCDACASFASAQRLVWSALDTWEAIPPSEDFDRKLYQRIEQHEQSGWWKRFRWKPAMPFAAAGVTAVAAMFLYAPVTLHETSRVETIEPEQVERTLEDLEMLKQLSLTPGSQRL